MKLETLKEILTRNGFELVQQNIEDKYADYLEEERWNLQDELEEYANLVDLRNKIIVALSRVERRKEQITERNKKSTFISGFDLGFVSGKEEALHTVLDEIDLDKIME